MASVLEAYRGRPDQVQAQAQAISRIITENLDEALLVELLAPIEPDDQRDDVTP